jgi:hypothetical protein
VEVCAFSAFRQARLAARTTAVAAGADAGGWDTGLLEGGQAATVTFNPSYSTPYRNAKESNGLKGSFGEKSWSRNAIA